MNRLSWAQYITHTRAKLIWRAERKIRFPRLFSESRTGKRNERKYFIRPTTLSILSTTQTLCHQHNRTVEIIILNQYNNRTFGFSPRRNGKNENMLFKSFRRRCGGDAFKRDFPVLVVHEYSDARSSFRRRERCVCRTAFVSGDHENVLWPLIPDSSPPVGNKNNRVIGKPVVTWTLKRFLNPLWKDTLHVCVHDATVRVFERDERNGYEWVFRKFVVTLPRGTTLNGRRRWDTFLNFDRRNRYVSAESDVPSAIQRTYRTTAP